MEIRSNARGFDRRLLGFAGRCVASGAGGFGALIENGVDLIISNQSHRLWGRALNQPFLDFRRQTLFLPPARTLARCCNDCGDPISNARHARGWYGLPRNF